MSKGDRWDWWTAGALVMVRTAPLFAVIGIPAVPVTWPLYRLGVVLPGCGMTSGVVALARTDLRDAWRWNLASVRVAVAVLAGVVRGVGVATRQWLHVHVATRRWTVIAALVTVGVLWVNQWRQAALLREGR